MSSGIDVNNKSKKCGKKCTAVIILIIAITILIHSWMQRVLYNNGTIRPELHEPDDKYNLHHLYKSFSENGVCNIDSLHRWWNSAITKDDFQRIPSQPCHKMEIDMSSLTPLRNRHGNTVSNSDSKNTSPVVITVCKVSGCLSINKTERGIAQVMNERNFEGVTCSFKNVSFYPNSTHHTALASFPGSGNTWTRHLLEYVSGILTGAIYNDKLLNKEFHGEGHTERVLVVKTHKKYNKHQNNYDSAVILIRAPIDCVLAYFNFEKTKSLTERTDLAAFNTSGWMHHVVKGLTTWKEFYDSWIMNFKGRKMILSYKRLRQDFFNEVFRLSQFLNVTVTYRRLWCAYMNQEGKFHRPPSKAIDKYELYDADMLKQIQSAKMDMAAKIRETFGIDGIL